MRPACLWSSQLPEELRRLAEHASNQCAPVKVLHCSRLQDCWERDPAKRPTFEEIVNRLRAMLALGAWCVAGGRGFWCCCCLACGYAAALPG